MPQNNEGVLTLSACGRRDWDSHPPLFSKPYKSSGIRAPKKPLLPLPHGLSEMNGPVFGHNVLGPLDADLTKNAAMNGAVLGERAIIEGRILDERGRPIPHTLVEIWQANAAGRYVHRVDQHNAPLDPNFFGAGRTVTDENGVYRFKTIKPGAYPWGNHDNAWRPAHIHFSLLGPTIASRLVTQMYFPGDPLLDYDPIFQAVPVSARGRLIAGFDLSITQSGIALGYAFDIVLRGRTETPFEGA